jgi:zeta-carotene desaturase
MAAVHGFQVFWLGFLARSDSYEMGVPAVGLGELYASESWQRLPNVRIHLKSAVSSLDATRARIAGAEVRADAYLAALPFERVADVCPLAPRFEAGHSPITGIHLWFDRPVTDLPHATLLDRTMQWMFNKDRGRVVQLVVSASRSLLNMPREEVVALALRELAEFFPAVNTAILERAHVVKEVRATFSARPGLIRPGNETTAPNVFVAGDWTASGWPATMEGAVRSGYLAAEAVTRYFGAPRAFVIPDVG